MSTSFIDSKGKHIPHAQNALGKGNQAFSSFKCLNGYNTSRKDDLISLLYIMFYLHTGDFSFFNLDIETATDRDIVVAKKNGTAKSMCKEELLVFKSFAKIILSLKFNETPSY